MDENLEYIKTLQNEIDKLERKLKVIEEDRDLSKYVMGELTGGYLQILKMDNVSDEVMTIVKETLHKCADYTKEHM